MNNNDVLRRLRYTFDLSDDKMIRLFGLGGLEVNREKVCAFLKPEDDPTQAPLRDKELAHYLNGLIISRRGRKGDETPKAEQRLNNNQILRKLKIALTLQVEDIISIMKSMKFDVSKHEITALFRKSDQKQYRECHDQFLRVFLQGLQEMHRPKEKEKRKRMGQVEKPDFVRKIEKKEEGKPAFLLKKKEDKPKLKRPSKPSEVIDDQQSFFDDIRKTETRERDSKSKRPRIRK